MKNPACESFNYPAHAREFELLMRLSRQTVRCSSQIIQSLNFLSLSGATTQHYTEKDRKFQRYHMVSQMQALRNSALSRPSVCGYLMNGHFSDEKGRPSPGPVQALPMVCFCLPNEKDHPQETVKEKFFENSVHERAF
ncbi:hypothetical protein KVQ82_09240 [Pseudomonas sp. AO-1]|uniref:hypothetical protein n=1 Tax=Pseudomonas sp. AO-1 TaxID=2855434 RepID=UPI001C7669B2|nr:hypothetical protein [Pseudomonas sp. AO-1]QXZ16073.1 hypothetical protein KVQ82_09240 [Pseudomonas sp. AO-1]